MAAMKAFSPAEDREELRLRIVNAVRGQFSEEEMMNAEFAEAMWMAMQSLCGPRVAAMAIRASQIHP